MKHKDEIKTKIGKRYDYDKMCDICMLQRNVKIQPHDLGVFIYLFLR